MKILIITNHSYMLYRFRRELIEALHREHKVVLSMPFVGHEDDFSAMGLRCINTPVDRRGINPKTDLKLMQTYRKLLKTEYAALPVTAAVATICHTLLVMGSIYVLLTQQYAAAKNVAISAVFGLIMGTVTASGIPEAIAAAILVTVIGKSLLNLLARMKKR